LPDDIKVPDLDQLLALLPHRYPFLLIDRVLELSKTHIVAVKNVAFNEPYFAGHFPGRPVMPGVLVVESLAQASAVLALSTGAGGSGAFFMLTGIDKLRLRRRVIPGDQLRLEVQLQRYHRPLWKMHGSAKVGDELAADADLSAMEVSGVSP
jgi:3-hydroxyacyl-[acyl-carrier-protein] dehydratase